MRTLEGIAKVNSPPTFTSLSLPLPLEWWRVYGSSLRVSWRCPQAVPWVQGGGRALRQEVHPSHPTAQLDKENITIAAKFILYDFSTSSCVDLKTRIIGDWFGINFASTNWNWNNTHQLNLNISQGKHFSPHCIVCMHMLQIMITQCDIYTSLFS